MKKVLNTIFCSVNGLRGLSCFLMCAVIVLTVILAIPDNDSAEPALSPSDTDSSGTIDHTDTAEDNKGKIFYNEGSLGQMWISVLPDVPKSEIEQYSFRETENGYKYYVDENGEKASLIGIDVSYYQGDIDWERVKASGVEYAMLRIGLRGYETGEMRVDTKFHEYIEGANNAGIPVGVYFFSQAISEAEAIEEARFVLDQIRGHQVDFPIVFDWETIGEDTARTNSVTSDMLTKCTIAFCEEIKNAGYTPMYYTNRSIGYRKLDLSQLTDYDLWIADFNEFPSFYYRYTMWQYTYTGRVDGIDTDVDLNVCFKDYRNTIDS